MGAMTSGERRSRTFVIRCANLVAHITSQLGCYLFRRARNAREMKAQREKSPRNDLPLKPLTILLYA